MTEVGQYIYAIIDTDREAHFGPMGIGEEKSEVYTIVHDGLGAVVSDSLVTQYPVTRANTMAHQKVMETVMKQYPMLPVRFGTVSEGLDPIRKKLLKGRQGELTETLRHMEGKIELGIKAIWKDMKPVFEEIVSQNKDISRLRDRLMKRRGGVQRDQVRLGEMVKDALEAWKEQKEQSILGPLEGLWVEKKLNDHFGDQMITNAAFLVEKKKEKAFDLAVEKVKDRYVGKMMLKYVGPIPPLQFRGNRGAVVEGRKTEDGRRKTDDGRRRVMAFILDDILFSPLKLTIWLGEKLRDAAYNEMTDESKIHEGLLHLQMRFEMEEISEEEFEKQETRLMEQLEMIRKMKEEG